MPRYLPFCCPFFISEVPSFLWYHFPSACSISYQAGLLVTFSHTFLSFENLFISSSILNNVLKHIKLGFDSSFRILFVLSQCLGLLWFLLRNPLSFKVFSPLMYCFAQVFYSSCYQIILSFVLNNFIIICPAFCLDFSVGDSLSFFDK